VLIDVLDSEGLPPLVIRRLFALLCHAAVTSSLLRERVDGLYRRLLESPIFDLSSLSAARRAAAAADAAAAGGKDAAGAEGASPDEPKEESLLMRYVGQLPAMCSKKDGISANTPSNAKTPTSASQTKDALAPLCDCLSVLEELLLRFGADASALARLAPLRIPLRAGWPSHDSHHQY